MVTVIPSFGLHEIEPLALTWKRSKGQSPGPRIVFLSSPWNPVGLTLDRTALEKLVAATRPGTLFVLDEVYFEFADPTCPNGLEVLGRSCIPYVVLRTFSKAHGLAGLRVGYAVCSDVGPARVLAAAKTPFNVNAAAQAAAIAALATRIG